MQERRREPTDFKKGAELCKIVTEREMKKETRDSIRGIYKYGIKVPTAEGFLKRVFLT